MCVVVYVFSVNVSVLYCTCTFMYVCVYMSLHVCICYQLHKYFIKCAAPKSTLYLQDFSKVLLSEFEVQNSSIYLSVINSIFSQILVVMMYDLTVPSIDKCVLQVRKEWRGVHLFSINMPK